MDFSLIEFTPNNGALYSSGNNGESNATWTGFYLPVGSWSGSSPPSSIPFSDSLASFGSLQKQNGGCYVFCGSEPAQSSAFYIALSNLLSSLNKNTPSYFYRYIFWFRNPNPQNGILDPDGSIPFLNSLDGKSVQTVKEADLQLLNLRFSIVSGVPITADNVNSNLCFQNFGNNRILLSQLSRNTPVPVGQIGQNIVLSFSETISGTFGFGYVLGSGNQSVASDLQILQVGFKYYYSGNSAQGLPFLYSQFFPVLGDVQIPRTKVYFNATLDILHPLDHERTTFVFANSPDTGKAPLFASYLRTDSGWTIQLLPLAGNSALVLQNDFYFARFSGSIVGQQPGFYFTLKGNFTLNGTILGGQSDDSLSEIRCGLSGVETISFSPTSGNYQGDSILFTPDQPAFADSYPPAAAAPYGSPTPIQQQLSNLFTTAYVSILPMPGSVSTEQNDYFSQPEGSYLYAVDSSLSVIGRLLGYQPSLLAEFPNSLPFFPMATYPGITLQPVAEGGFSTETLIDYESHVLSAIRKRVLCKGNSTLSSSEPKTSGPTTTTPQGFLVTLSDTSSWQSILLAQNDDVASSLNELQFENIDASIRNAFQSNQLFLVVTQLPQDYAGFDNYITIEGWPFQINVGTGTYGDYKNVIIFKFCKGPLVNRIQSPQLWTDASSFNHTNNNELAAISQWLQDYMADAESQTDTSFQNFNEIVNDENWNGILVLKADVPSAQFPSDLEALVAGIDLNNFYAHHFGVSAALVTTQTGPTPSIGASGNSSLFGLIHYVDSVYAGQIASGANPNWPVVTQAKGTYDFRVLYLIVLFENTAIRTFQCQLQLTVNSWFGDAVAPRIAGSPPGNAVVLQGSFQDHNGNPVYSFNSIAENQFNLQSRILNYVTVSSAQFLTVTGSSSTTQASAQFVLSGFLNFRILPGEKNSQPTDVDLLSYGSSKGNILPDEGLYFSNIYVNLSFPITNPSNLSFTFDASRISFNPGLSSPSRAGSLCSNFPLNPIAILDGNALGSYSSQNYLPVISDALQASSVSQNWNALVFQLDLGSPGALSSSGSFSADLILAWSPLVTGFTPPAFQIGFSPPGGSGLSAFGIEDILKIGIDQIQLLESETPGVYLIRFTNLALRFFGISLPPGGSTILFLFGSPAGNPSTGIGWYAAYNQSNSTPKQIASEPEKLP